METEDGEDMDLGMVEWDFVSIVIYAREETHSLSIVFTSDSVWGWRAGSYHCVYSLCSICSKQ